MARRSTLLACALAACLVAAGCGRKPDLSLNRMLRQERYEPYGPGRLFADGMAMQAPPDGAISREKSIDPLRAEASDEGSTVKYVPVTVTADLLARGRDRFDIYCAVCHGVLGDGDCVVARKMQLVRPPSLHLDKVRALSAGELYRVVEMGYGVMPNYAAELSIDDRWAVVAYVQALQQSQSAKADELPAPVRAKLESIPR